MDVNTKEQYEFMLQLYDYLYPRNPYFCIRDIIDWYDGVYKKTTLLAEIDMRKVYFNGELVSEADAKNLDI